MSLSFLDKKEIKLFLTFFILYSFFVHWVGWNEETRITLTKTIISEHRFEIDTYANFTGDRSLYRDHYYIDKAPGSSFMALPLYSFFNHTPIYSKENKILLPEPQFNTTVYLWIDYPEEERILQALSVIFLSSLPGALLIVLIYKISKFFIKNLKYRLFCIRPIIIYL